MTPEETKRMVNLIRDLSNRTETTFFIIEHDMNVVFSISDRIVVLYYGSILADGAPDNPIEPQGKRSLSGRIDRC